MSKVIAIGPKGGKIVGYKGGQPIYLNGDDGSSSSAGKVKQQSAWDKLVGSQGAFAVVPQADYAAWEASADASVVEQQASEGVMGSTLIRHEGQIFVKIEDTSAINAASRAVTNNIMAAFRATLTSATTHKQSKLVAVPTKSKIAHVQESVEITKGAMFAQVIAPSHAKAVTWANTALANAKNQHGAAASAALAFAMIEDRLMLSAISGNVKEARMDISCSDKGVLAISSSPAFSADAPASLDALQFAGKGSPDGVLQGVFEFIQSPSSKAVAAHLLALISTAKERKAQGSKAAADAVSATREIIRSVSTAMSRADAEFGTKSSEAIGRLLSLHDAVISFAEMSVAGTGVLDNADNTQIKAGDEAKADEPLADATSAAPEPDKDWFDPKNLKGDAQPLLGSTAGGFIVNGVVIKNSKHPDAEIGAHNLFGSVLGAQHCPPAESVSSTPKGVKGASVKVSNGVATKFVPNKGALPKSGAAMEAMLTKDQKAQLVGLGIMSWVVGDADAHGGNYLIGEDGNLVRIDLGQAGGVYKHLTSEPSYHVSPNSNEIALNSLLSHYAGEFSSEAPDADIDLNHPFILDALKKIESFEYGSGGLSSFAKGRAKKARAHFEAMISAAMTARAGKSTTFKFGEGDGAMPAWSAKGKTPLMPHNFSKPFAVGETLESLGGTQGAKIVRNKYDGAKYVYKKFPPNKKLSALAECVGSSMAGDLMMRTTGSAGNVVTHTTQAYSVPNSGELEVVQRRLFNKGTLGWGANPASWTDSQRQEMNALAMTRYLLGDHDGHGEQYLWTDPPSGGDASIIGIDWGNAFKHATKSAEAVDIQQGYMDFSPQTTKLDAKLYKGYANGDFDVDFKSPHIMHIAKTCAEQKESLLAKMEPYLEEIANKFGQSAADKARKKTDDKLSQFVTSYETFVTSLMEQRAKKLGDPKPAPFKLYEQASKSLSFSGINVSGRSNPLYKSIATIDVGLLFEDINTGELTEFAEDLLTAFAVDISNAFGDQQVSDSMLKTQPRLRQQAFRLAPLEEHVTLILQDSRSRRAYL